MPASAAFFAWAGRAVADCRVVTVFRRGAPGPSAVVRLPRDGARLETILI